MLLALLSLLEELIWAACGVAGRQSKQRCRVWRRCWEATVVADSLSATEWRLLEQGLLLLALEGEGGVGPLGRQHLRRLTDLGRWCGRRCRRGHLLLQELILKELLRLLLRCIEEESLLAWSSWVGRVEAALSIVLIHLK